LKRDPFQLGKSSIIFKKKTAVFSGSVAGLKSDPPGLQDCIFSLESIPKSSFATVFWKEKNHPSTKSPCCEGVRANLKAARLLRGPQEISETPAGYILGNILHQLEPKNIYIQKIAIFEKKQHQKFRWFFF